MCDPTFKRQKTPLEGFGVKPGEIYYTSRTNRATAHYNQYIAKLRASEEEERRGDDLNKTEERDQQQSNFFIRCDRKSLIKKVAQRVDLAMASYQDDLDKKRARLSDLLTKEEEDNIRKFVVQVQSGAELAWKEKEDRLAYLLAKRQKEHEEKYKDTPLLAIQDVTVALRSSLNVWYLDDGTIGGRPEVVSEDLRSLVEGFRRMGLEVNAQKCELYSCSGQASQEVLSQVESVVPGLKILDRSNFLLLGAPIFAEGIPEVLASKMRALRATKCHLSQLSAHVALTILRSCLSMPRMTYDLRTAPVWLYRQETARYDATLKDLSETVLNIEMTSSQLSQASLPIRHGGLGIRRLQDTELPVFLSSSFGVLDLVTRILAIHGDGFSIPFAEEALELWQARCPGSDLPETPQSQRSWDEVLCKNAIDFLLSSQSGVELARLRAVTQPESGIWLHALPSPQLGTLMDDDSLRVAVALRLGCNVCHPHRCVCGAQVDARGRHGLHCVRSAGRLSRHCSINDIVKRALIAANIPSVLEPQGLSTTDGKRPDGLTMIPWERGRCLVWDATCVCTFAPSHVASTSLTPGAAAEEAARLKCQKYGPLLGSYIFAPLALETTGVWGLQGKAFVKEIGRRLRNRGLDFRSGAYLMQRISLAVQRGNAASVLGTFGSDMARVGLLV
ncbi:unnamed protein product [Plutella xylostella]|uniref:(diamondback moth) hypothetical protein n=1 Tax=Plutella xylostella TaxID=51655 RepID=A0A8S4G3M1_PLUXY|nr:unnamed protein product [Plutella xylostella]